RSSPRPHRGPEKRWFVSSSPDRVGQSLPADRGRPGSALQPVSKRAEAKSNRGPRRTTARIWVRHFSDPERHAETRRPSGARVPLSAFDGSFGPPLTSAAHDNMLRETPSIKTELYATPPSHCRHHRRFVRALGLRRAKRDGRAARADGATVGNH